MTPAMFQYYSHAIRGGILSDVLRSKVKDLFGVSTAEFKDLHFSIEEKPSQSTITVTLPQGPFRFQDESVVFRVHDAPRYVAKLADFLKAVESLKVSSRIKSVLKMRYAERLSLEEIAERLNYGSSSPESALRRGSHELEEKMGVKVEFDSFIVEPDDSSTGK